MDAHRLCRRGPTTLLTTGLALAGIGLAGCTVPTPQTPPAGNPATMPPEASPATSSTSDGQPTAGNGGPTTVGNEPSPTQQTDRCHTSMLAASFENLEAGAGQRNATLVLRNISAQTCAVYGYPGMQLVGADGRLIPTTVERNTDATPKLITLTPGASAVSTLKWTAINSESEPSSPCEPSADHAQVTPPDERDPLDAGWTMGMVCNQGTIGVSSFHQ